LVHANARSWFLLGATGARAWFTTLTQITDCR